MSPASSQHEPVLGFSGDHAFLSNFHPSQVTLDGRLCPNVEVAYQGAKCTDDVWRSRILSAAGPKKAKRIARSAPHRPDWLDVRVEIMRGLLRQKFSWPHLRRALLATEERELVEVNHWGDTFWGKTSAEGELVGENTLGLLLMQVRDELIGSTQAPPVLVAFDIEATCWDRPVSDEEGIPPHEVIEIGAVAWAASAESSRAEFQEFVRPVERPALSRFCRELTTIHQEQVDLAGPLSDVLPRFLQWCARFGESYLISWGKWDCNHLREECTRKDIPLALIEARHVNLKPAFAEHMLMEKQVGLGRAASTLGIPVSEPQHRAIADARTIADILDHGLGRSIQERHTVRG